MILIKTRCGEKQVNILLYHMIIIIIIVYLFDPMPEQIVRIV